MKSVIVTGAGGFIGSNMTEFLLENTDYNIYAIDNLQSGLKIYNNFLKPLIENNTHRIKFIKIDYKDFLFLKKRTDDIIDNPIDIVYHFAALPSVPYSVENPVKTTENNIQSTLSFIEFCKSINVKKFIFSSSSSVYGNTHIFPTPEETETYPLSPYALQKDVIENFLRLYDELYGFNSISLRYFNVYGKNQYAENAYANVISAWIKSAVSGEPLRMDGDGTQSRDFIYVTDVCKANFLIGEYPTKIYQKIFNVANGKSVSLLDIKEIIYKIHKSEIPINYQPKRKGDVEKSLADIFSIKSLGFTPEIDIEKGIKMTYDWYKKTI